MKKLLTLAFMLCVCAGIHATREIVGATAIVAPCQGVPNIVILGKATPEQIQAAHDMQRQRCLDKGAQDEGNRKVSTELH